MCLHAGRVKAEGGDNQEGKDWVWFHTAQTFIQQGYGRQRVGDQELAVRQWTNQEKTHQTDQVI